MFDTKVTDLRVRMTELELRLDALLKSFRSLEQEWNGTLSRYDSILKRVNRLLKVDKDDADVHSKTPADLQISAGLQELTPEVIENLWRTKHGG